MSISTPKELWVNFYGHNDFNVHSTEAEAGRSLDPGGVTGRYKLVVPKRQVRAYVVRRYVRRTDMGEVVYEYQDPAGGWTEDRYFAERYTLDRHDVAKEDAEDVNAMDSDLPKAHVVRIVKKESA